MKIRQHRGGLEASMETVEMIEPTREAIATWAALAYKIPCKPEDLKIEHVCYDSRIEWDTYLVSLQGYGVLGMSDGPVT